MARKYKKRSYRRSYKRKTRGKRQTLKRTIQRVLNKNTEIKYYDVSDENVVTFHNIGTHTAPGLLANVASDPTFFNPWSDIPPGTGRGNPA